jgi:cytochrome oxidase assembly protein ShyY1
MPEKKNRLHFDFEWRITLFTLIMTPLMLSLGVWQLERADEKAAIASSFEERQRQSPVPVSDLWAQPAAALAYVPVQVSGHYIADQYFLLDNQIHNGKFGYQVLNVLRLSNSAGSVLVNRGWIAGDAGRRGLPNVPVIAGPVSVIGQVYVAPGKPYLLAEQQLQKGWPKVIQAVEMDKLEPAVSTQRAESVFRYPVRIAPGQQGALTTDWQIVNMSPQKHHGYAVQWFAMAAILVMFYLLRSSNIGQVISGIGKTGK